MHILVVEDDEMILRTLEFRLKKDGYTVTAVKDGKAALEELQSKTFNLVITDLMLPFVTGLEILSYVRSKLPELLLPFYPGLMKKEPSWRHSKWEQMTLSPNLLVRENFLCVLSICLSLMLRKMMCFLFFEAA